MWVAVGELVHTATQTSTHRNVCKKGVGDEKTYLSIDKNLNDSSTSVADGLLGGCWQKPALRYDREKHERRMCGKLIISV